MAEIILSKYALIILFDMQSALKNFCGEKRTQEFRLFERPWEKCLGKQEHDSGKNNLESLGPEGKWVLKHFSNPAVLNGHSLTLRHLSHTSRNDKETVVHFIALLLLFLVSFFIDEFLAISRCYCSIYTSIKCEFDHTQSSLLADQY